MPCSSTGYVSCGPLFSAVADIISWVLHQQGVEHHLHYLDDFLLLGAPDSKQAAAAMEIALSIFHVLGIPIATHKTEGPATALGFLGILIDTQAFELRLPAEKLARLQESLRLWSHRTLCTRRELESLLGHLSHAATVVVQGRTFLRQLFPLLALDRAPHHFIRLNAGARADLLYSSKGGTASPFSQHLPLHLRLFQMPQVRLAVVHSPSLMGGFSFSGRRVGPRPTLQPRSLYQLSLQQPCGVSNGYAAVCAFDVITWL